MCDFSVEMDVNHRIIWIQLTFSKTDTKKQDVVFNVVDLMWFRDVMYLRTPVFMIIFVHDRQKSTNADTGFRKFEKTLPFDFVDLQ